MDFQPLHTRLASEWSLLRGRWAKARTQWSDSVQQFMEREVFEEFEKVVPSVIEELQRLGDLVARAQRELE
jgi:hypothetical protein